MAEEVDEIDFEDEYDKADPIDDDSLDESMTILNKSIREQKSYKKSLVELNGHQRIKMNERSWNSR